MTQTTGTGQNRQVDYMTARISDATLGYEISGVAPVEFTNFQAEFYEMGGQVIES